MEICQNNFKVIVRKKQTTYFYDTGYVHVSNLLLLKQRKNFPQFLFWRKALLTVSFIIMITQAEIHLYVSNKL